MCFEHFHFEMCFAPQRRALFAHLNFQKCSEANVFCWFWLRNVLCATTACTFSSSQLPKVVWECEFFYTFVFHMRFARQRRGLFHITTFKKCSGVGFCRTFSLRNVLRATAACNFSSLICPDASARATLANLLFDPLVPQINGKTQCFATFYFFSRTCIFFLLLLSSLHFSSLLFSDASHLCFSICPYCRKFDF